MNLTISSTCLGLALLLVHSPLYAGQAIEIHGEYSRSVFDLPKHVYKEPVRESFVVTLDGTAWSIAVTNSVDPTMWDVVAFDGTNTITVSPTNEVKWLQLPNRDGLEFISISSSKIYDNLVDSKVFIYIPWMVYGLSPSNITSNKTGLVDIPLPWKVPRYYPTAYGYKWIIEPTPDNRFISTCSIVRDTSLDCTNELDELLRYGFDCPTNLSRFRDKLAIIGMRKEIQDGFVDTTYACTEYTNIEGTTVPKEATMMRYVHMNDGSAGNYCKINLSGSNFIVRQKVVSLLPARAGPVYVQDYRYKKMRDRRVFPYANYILEPSDTWKSADEPDLMKKADDYLNTGRQFDDFGLVYKWYTASPAFRSGARCVLLAVLLMPICIMFGKTAIRRVQNKQVQ
jgi:hypothetical protein